jgi:hypothetical protein
MISVLQRPDVRWSKNYFFGQTLSLGSPSGKRPFGSRVIDSIARPPVITALNVRLPLN